MNPYGFHFIQTSTVLGIGSRYDEWMARNFYEQGLNPLFTLRFILSAVGNSPLVSFRPRYTIRPTYKGLLPTALRPTEWWVMNRRARLGLAVPSIFPASSLCSSYPLSSILHSRIHGVWVHLIQLKLRLGITHPSMGDRYDTLQDMKPSHSFVSRSITYTPSGHILHT